MATLPSRGAAVETIVATTKEERAAVMFHALGNPLRLAILHYIMAHPGCIGNDLVLRFGRAQATISQHLAVLRRARLVVAERDGHMTCYAVNCDALAALGAELRVLNDQVV